MMAAYLLGKGAAPQLTGNNKPRPVDPDPGGSVSFSMDPDLTLLDNKVKATFTQSLRNSVTTVFCEIKAKSKVTNIHTRYSVVSKGWIQYKNCPDPECGYKLSSKNSVHMKTTYEFFSPCNRKTKGSFPYLNACKNKTVFYQELLVNNLLVVFQLF